MIHKIQLKGFLDLFRLFGNGLDNFQNKKFEFMAGIIRENNSLPKLFQI